MPARREQHLRGWAKVTHAVFQYPSVLRVPDEQRQNTRETGILTRTPSGPSRYTSRKTFTWPPAKMTGEPEGLGLYGMVTPFGGDWGRRGKKLSLCTFPTVVKQPYSEATLYLEHNNTDLLDTLNDGLWGPCNGDGTLCWVGQHVPCYLYLSSCWLQKHNNMTELHNGYYIFKKNLYTTSPMQLTSLISLILQPPLPMSEPHWLAGTTRRMVTGGLLVAVLLVIEVLMSWTEHGGGKV